MPGMLVRTAAGKHENAPLIFRNIYPNYMLFYLFLPCACHSGHLSAPCIRSGLLEKSVTITFWAAPRSRAVAIHPRDRRAKMRCRARAALSERSQDHHKTSWSAREALAGRQAARPCPPRLLSGHPRETGRLSTLAKTKSMEGQRLDRIRRGSGFLSRGNSSLSAMT